MDPICERLDDTNVMSRLVEAETSNKELQMENYALALQIASLEEIVIQLSQDVGRLERHVGVGAAPLAKRTSGLPFAS